MILESEEKIRCKIECKKPENMPSIAASPKPNVELNAIFLIVALFNNRKTRRKTL
jgi:hypothetical protein